MNGIGFSGSGVGIISLVPVFMVVIFVIVIGGIVYSIFTHAKNASAAKETVFARVVSKRMDVRHHANHHNHNDVGHAGSSSRTYYYITLEFDNGERREYVDVKKLYGLVVEGDTGYASIQGDWIVDFQRQMGGQPL